MSSRLFSTWQKEYPKDYCYQVPKPMHNVGTSSAAFCEYCSPINIIFQMFKINMLQQESQKWSDGNKYLSTKYIIQIIVIVGLVLLFIKLFDSKKSSRNRNTHSNRWSTFFRPPRRIPREINNSWFWLSQIQLQI